MKRGWFYWFAVVFACWHATGVVIYAIEGSWDEALDDLKLALLWTLIATLQDRVTRAEGPTK